MLTNLRFAIAARLHWLALRIFKLYMATRHAALALEADRSHAA